MQCLGFPKAGVSLLVGGAWPLGVQWLVLFHWWVKPGPGVSGYRALRVPELEFSHCWTGPVHDTVGWGSGGSKTGINLLVGGAGSWGGWLRCPRCLSAGIGLLVGELHHNITSFRVTVVLGLVSTHWWLKPVIEASVGPLVGGAVSLFLAVRHGGCGLRLVCLHWCVSRLVGRTCPTVAMGSESLNTAVLLVVGAVSLPD